VSNPEGVEKGVVMLYPGRSEAPKKGATPIPDAPKQVYLQGAWRSQDEYVELAGTQGRITFRYKAKDVNMVLSPTGDVVELMLQGQGGIALGSGVLGSGVLGSGVLGSVLGGGKVEQPSFYLLQDNEPLQPLNAGVDVAFSAAGQAIVVTDRPRMYRLISNPDFEEHELTLVVSGKGFAAYSAAFTTCVAPA